MEMVYPQRKAGEIVGFTKWPSSFTDNTPIDVNSTEFQDFLNKPKPKIAHAIKGLTEGEHIKLIDFIQTNGIVTAARAKKLKGQ